MKKIYTEQHYIESHKNKIQKVERNKRRRKKRRYHNVKLHNNHHIKRSSESNINFTKAPKDFRLLDNTKQCVDFFSEVRKNTDNNLSSISLKEVTQIDYASLSILSAINEEFMSQKIKAQGILPENVKCKKYIIDSGFLNKMKDTRGNNFPQSTNSDSLRIEIGQDKFDKNEEINDICNTITNRVGLDISAGKPIYSILLEICGNTVEWSEAKNKQWLIGVKYETERAIVTVTDLGKGILGTLQKNNQNFKNFLINSKDKLLVKNKIDILNETFKGKHSSKSKDINRNKGLLKIKDTFKKNQIKSLKVLTNDVILHFDDINKSQQLKSSSEFEGTFYYWTITKD